MNQWAGWFKRAEGAPAPDAAGSDEPGISRLVFWSPTLPAPPPPPAVVVRPPGVVLGVDADTGAEVFLGDSERLNGLYIIGKPGRGKSSLLEDLIVQDLRAGAGLCVLDPHGDLFEHVLARVPEGRTDDVVLIDLRDTDHYAGLNLFFCDDLTDLGDVTDAVERVFHVFERLWGPHGENPSWGPQLEEVLRNCIHTLVKNPGMTMVELPKLLDDAGFRNRMVASLNDDDDGPVKDFWVERFGQMSDGQQRVATGSTRNKLSHFLAQPMVKYVVGQSKSTVDFRYAMDYGQIVLVRLDARKKAVTSLIGSLIVGLIYAAAGGRPEGSRRQFNLYADEFPFFATSDFAELVFQARKFGIATTVAHQTRGQLRRAGDAVVDATLAMLNMVVFQVQRKDADELAGEFDSTPKPGKGQPVTDPYKTLESRGHPNPEVMREFHHLQALLRAADEAADARDHARKEHARLNTHFDRRQYGPYAPYRAAPQLTGRAEKAAVDAAVRQYLYRRMVCEDAANPADDPSLRFGYTAPGAVRRSLDWLGYLLSEEPLEIPGTQTGSTSPGARREDIKNQLANARRYQARIKLLRDDESIEHWTTTPRYHPPVTDTATLERLAAIRAASQRHFSRTKQAIDDEIRNRRPTSPRQAIVRDVAPSALDTPQHPGEPVTPGEAPIPEADGGSHGLDRYEPL